MIIWLNGAFGAGKTTVEHRVRERLPGSRSFDPELIGYLPDQGEAAARDWRHAQLARAAAALTGLADREPDTIEVRNHGRPPDEVAVEIVRRVGLSGG